MYYHIGLMISSSIEKEQKQQSKSKNYSHVFETAVEQDCGIEPCTQLLQTSPFLYVGGTARPLSQTKMLVKLLVSPMRIDLFA